jgi:hypothetical protein
MRYSCGARFMVVLGMQTVRFSLMDDGITSSERPNELPAVDGGIASRFQIGHRWPAATEKV